MNPEPILAGSGSRGVDHVGLTVPDLDGAIDFFTRVLTAELVFRHGPYRTTGDHLPRQFGRHPESTVEGIAMLRLGGTNVELLQYSSPDRVDRPPSLTDAGGHHLAVYVDDLEGAVDRLRRHGCEVLGDPMDLPGPESGPSARFIFFRAPWGLFCELVSYPHGKAYESTTDRRLVDPRALPRSVG